MLMFILVGQKNALKQTADQAVILDPPLLSYFWKNCVEVVP